MENNIKLYLGDNRIILKQIPNNSVDAVVTDAPYELGFMGKSWDSTGIAYDINLWKEVLRVLKPGGHLLAFSGSRTYHRMTCAIEDAGFEVRDMINWLYGSGFTKSLNIGKAIDKLQGNEREIIGIKQHAKKDFKDNLYAQAPANKNNEKIFGYGEEKLTKGNSEWEGYGTALKPAHEPIVLARKKISEKTIAENCLKWGVGGLAIDNCRVSHNEPVKTTNREQRKAGWNSDNCGFDSTQNTQASADIKGRFPANLIHDGSDEVLKIFPNTKSGKGNGNAEIGKVGKNVPLRRGTLISRNDDGSASRFFKECKGDIECENVNIVENNLNQQERVEDFVLKLVAIEGLPEDKQLKNIIQPFMNEIKKILNQTSKQNIEQMKNIGKKCLQELWHIGMEQLNNNPVKYAEIQKQINTTMIITNLLNIDGFVENIISSSILNNMVLGGKDCLSRFKYCAKTSSSERNQGLQESEILNTHPTVKPIALMKYLITLISREGQTILDPFMGSGSTGMAAKELNRKFIGIEKELNYIEIAQARIKGTQIDK